MKDKNSGTEDDATMNWVMLLTLQQWGMMQTQTVEQRMTFILQLTLNSTYKD